MNSINKAKVKWVGVVLGLFLTAVVWGAIPAPERAALINLYHSTGGDNWRNNSGWKTSPLFSDGFAMPGTEGHWFGLTVTGDHVTKINLPWNLLQGPIPSTIGNLSQLQELDLFLNEVNGSIPTELGNLVHLTRLSFWVNSIGGSIPPSLGNLGLLIELNLTDNQLTGIIPPELGHLHLLPELLLSGNMLSGPIPTSIKNMTLLKTICLNHNQLTGSIPPELGNLGLLENLDLSNNQLSGTIPASLGNLGSLSKLNLGQNQLTGSIPPQLGNLSQLENLNLPANQLSGSIPLELKNLSKLQDMNLAKNHLSGPIPKELGEMPYLNFLTLGSNTLTGSIPPGVIYNHRSRLGLDHNNLSGPIPEPTSLPITSLFWSGLDLSSNHLTGEIPPILFYIMEFEGELNLSNNHLSGNIRLDSEEEIIFVTQLNLANNDLSGPILPILKKFIFLEELNISGNRFTGTIPGSFFKPELYSLNISSNKFIGDIPIEITHIYPYLINIGYNSLSTENDRVIRYLNKKDPDWLETQNIPPTSVSAAFMAPGSVKVSWQPILYTADPGGYWIYTSTSPDGPWTLSGSTPSKSDADFIVTGLFPYIPYYFKVRTVTDPHPKNKNTLLSLYSPVVSALSSATSPIISIDKRTFYFGAIIGKPAPPTQRFSINNSGGWSLNWTAQSDQNWLLASPSAGTSGQWVEITIDPSSRTAGIYTGTITIRDPNATNSPQTVAVTLNVKTEAQDVAPLGDFDTPIDGSTLMGSIPVTGWALDDVGVESVKIYREDGASLVYMGDATLVAGARPDIITAYPDYPNNDHAGWGYLLLTQGLPYGDGIYKLHAVATDGNGNSTDLGTKTITVDNAHSQNPFGAMDTPAQGGTASGKEYVNFGWVLTPQPNFIPTDGSTLHVWIDGEDKGHPTYNNYREDIATLFPGYANRDGAVGYLYLDTTSYQNGTHTIQWTATDSAGNTDGIGSRYFTIQNSGGSDTALMTNGSAFISKNEMAQLMPSPTPVGVNKGYANEAAMEESYPDENSIIHLHIKELEPLRIYFTPQSTVNISQLPIGSTFNPKTGVFSWLPGPGFIGQYWFVFLEIDPNGQKLRKEIGINIVPKFQNSKEE